MPQSSSSSSFDTKPAASENTPLLGILAEDPELPIADGEIITHDEQSHQNGNGASKNDTPLPKLQIFMLCYARMIEPIAFFSIFPFISEMIFSNGDMEQSDVGFYAGLIVCPPFPRRFYLSISILSQFLIWW